MKISHEAIVGYRHIVDNLQGVLKSVTVTLTLTLTLTLTQFINKKCSQFNSLYLLASQFKQWNFVLI